jgi:L-amino acid N-acyltransferase YncA
MNRHRQVSASGRAHYAIRPADISEWALIWPIFRAVIAAGDTFVYAQSMRPDEARALWFANAAVLVAVDARSAIIGTARIGPNYPGPGAHVASASVMVSPDHRGRGVGRALGEYLLLQAAAEGYRAMQFNAVVATNQTAVRLWTDLGFVVIGASPEAFLHPRDGYVDLHIMHHDLSAGRMPRRTEG